jgi:hypothetical protein
MSKRNITQWKRRAQPPTELVLPSGAVVEVRRVSLSALLAQGLVPQSFFADVPKKKTSDMSAEEKQEFMAETVRKLQDDPQGLADSAKLARAVAKDAVVWPTVVDRITQKMEQEEAKSEGKLAYVLLDDIPLEDLFAIMNYALDEAPVETQEGEVPAAAIASFPENLAVQSGGGDGADVSAATQ